MPNIRAAMKRVRADVKRRDRNLEAKSKLKTMVRQFAHSIEEKKADEAKKLYPLLTRLLDQSARKGILHRNTASRKKSRLALQLAKLR
ncbi:MAG: 30S ribosomal protein S20 [Candidatus Omnitrophota bacterium]|nr:30S ribosomal protein S20 [Candidatus Omnitrophota bacterium]